MSGIFLLSLALSGVPAADSTSVIVVVGAPGDEDYKQQFTAWADRWEQAVHQGGSHLATIGRADRSLSTVETNDPEGDRSLAISDRQQLQQLIEAEPPTGQAPLWIVLIGHGTFDGRQAKFNLRGPDVSATEFAEWLAPIARPVVVINCASASGPFIDELSAAHRVVVTSTKSGFEQNYARFGKYLSESIADSRADLDKDGQTSLFEAFLMASRQCDEFYEVEGRLATEHALLDDNGDKQGTRADLFRGLRPVGEPEGDAPADGMRAHQLHLVKSKREQQMPTELRLKRDELEIAVIGLRDRKSQLPQEEYYARLESLLVELAQVYEQADSAANTTRPDAARE